MLGPAGREAVVRRVTIEREVKWIEFLQPLSTPQLFSTRYLKGAAAKMSTQNTLVESFTPRQALPTDEIGNEVYSSHYAERKMSRFVIGTETILLLGGFIHERAAASGDRARSADSGPGPYDPESDPQYPPAGRLPCGRCRSAIVHQWLNLDHPEVQPAAYLR